MGIAEIQAAGENAALLAQAALNMNSINNEHRPNYDSLLASIVAAYPGRTMQTMTDAEVNAFFFNGLADATTLTEAMGILTQWEISMLCLSNCVSLLPGNNL